MTSTASKLLDSHEAAITGLGHSGYSRKWYWYEWSFVLTSMLLMIPVDKIAIESRDKTNDFVTPANINYQSGLSA